MRLPPHSDPHYQVQHSGPVIVAGSALCLHDDLAACRAIYGDIPVIAINGAASIVKAFALFSIHTDRFVKYGHEWIDQQKRRFGDDFTVHGTPRKRDHPWVDYWWPGIRKGGGSSSWCARRMATYMGFDTVILCGAPLDPMNYAGPDPTDNLPGEMMSQMKYIERYRKQVEADVEWHGGAYSMSGWTRDLLGSPPPDGGVRLR